MIRKTKELFILRFETNQYTGNFCSKFSRHCIGRADSSDCYPNESRTELETKYPEMYDWVEGYGVPYNHEEYGQQWYQICVSGSQDIEFYFELEPTCDVIDFLLERARTYDPQGIVKVLRYQLYKETTTFKLIYNEEL
jgi:hypothetical protein